ncbi:hypothetical protein [Lichenifustis flavocetrariae]|uniref:Alcohol dehydrogenase n=1 Tax=Lichenifustis flavocetrariae TaxID=2949735 RepID=A0AA41Z254_9HYPH|nr:hypothetical protein [Lichenifustis flavocetrariae]MCW6511445.1 hypothetical protein [Lichenifustis flavocetrariae]
MVTACYDDLFSLYDAGRIEPRTLSLYPLDRVGDAIASLRDRTASGRPVLVMR